MPKHHDYKTDYHPSQDMIEAEHAESLDALAEVPDNLIFSRAATGGAERSGVGASVEAGQTKQQEYDMGLPEDNDVVPEELRLLTRRTATMESIFYFGKHKGKQFEDVLSDHEGYIRWLAEKEVIEFDEECLAAMALVGIA